MDLPDELLRGIYSYGFEKPSAIQQRACKPTMLGKDLIAQAQSGTVRYNQQNAAVLFGIVLGAMSWELGMEVSSKGMTINALITHLSSLNYNVTENNPSRNQTF